MTRVPHTKRGSRIKIRGETFRLNLDDDEPVDRAYLHEVRSKTRSLEQFDC